MNAEEFRKFGHAAIDFVADYLENIRERPVLSSVEPGYLHKLLPSDAPEYPETWQDVMKDINDKILPGMTHWQSPNFHAYYPTQTSYPSIVGELISNGLGVQCFSWMCSPACTELEVIVMDWLGKFLGLSDAFLNCSHGPGGGVIQGSASEAILVAILTAREQATQRLKLEHPDWSESDIRGKLVMYSSDQSNSAVEKSALLAAVSIRLLPVDSVQRLPGDTLRHAIAEDIRMGKIPICCIATHGTTSTCAFDNLLELGPICQEFKIWLHLDSAYAGSALCCPEFRPLMQGIEYADSININLYKWMMINFDCCAMWFKNANLVIDSFNVDRIYLKHKFQGECKNAPDYHYWQISLGRRFRALKVWITLRTIGTENIRERIRKQVQLAKLFENKVRCDSRFEIVGKPALGLVCFRLKGGCDKTQQLLDRITDGKKVYMVRSKCNGKFMIRFVVGGYNPEERDMDFAWEEIASHANYILNTNQSKIEMPTKDFVKNVVICDNPTDKTMTI